MHQYTSKLMHFQALLIYASGVYANMGNYKSFGDSKFIPNLPKVKLTGYCSVLLDDLLMVSFCDQPFSIICSRQSCINISHIIGFKNVIF